MWKILKINPLKFKNYFYTYLRFSTKYVIKEINKVKKTPPLFVSKLYVEKTKLFSISLLLLSHTKKNDSINDEEIASTVEEFESQLIKPTESTKSYTLGKTDLSNNMNRFGKDWEKMMDTKEIRLWRRKYPGNDETFEYRVCGTYTDISAKAFMLTQIDLAYRKEWDNMVIMLNVIFNEEQSQTEIIRWVSYYPYPLANREYIYLRRFLIDELTGRAVVISRAIDSHQKVDKILNDDSSPSIVRVTDYVSKLFVQAHSNYEEAGMDYFLIYYDNPKANIPRSAMMWASASGVPNFIKKLHDAAMVIHKKHRKK